jgi:hypothetical protein
METHAQGIPHALIERFPKAGHFPMLEEPTEFSQKLKNFLDKAHPNFMSASIFLSSKDGAGSSFSAWRK